MFKTHNRQDGQGKGIQMFVSNVKQRGHLKHSGVDGSILLNWISKT